MPILQIYKDDKNARLFDGHLTITFDQANYNFHTGFSKNAMTTILKHRGYLKCGNWEKADWGWQCVFCKGKRI